MPARRRTVVRLVDDDEVEEVLGELRQPLVRGRAELLDVGQDDVRLLADGKVARVERPEIETRRASVCPSIAVSRGGGEDMPQRSRIEHLDRPALDSDQTPRCELGQHAN